MKKKPRRRHTDVSNHTDTWAAVCNVKKSPHETVDSFLFLQGGYCSSLQDIFREIYRLFHLFVCV